ncbi:antibiotic biosynthesis monooxygenase family protein [Pseudomonas gingeri]|nr:antibiotic biosynthesis monooxygenase [Pseudomonas gingeri]NWA02645.1 antibiotic biosynthesis monooxygenase [Pseudomonas gingeri]NWA12182.1 antibiotic biosynthesis monooxygenase [Pseudomonas gingeri]NWA57412.1 antibiotic biosynthesis monooxygenase [Pseudomonas gingeri]NWA93755.1 antibiotic biosynthesis monooxygenase [Pseudomonas gingeri]NWB03227.1 antibiotic biosynthesis monooxygenase [Pseudomonas gingeri]
MHTLMPIVAISTVEIQAAEGHSTDLQARLNALVETLQGDSGCLAYHLAPCSSHPDAWIMTGYWSALATMQAHFELPCLTELFSLTRERLASALAFGTFRLGTPGSKGNTNSVSLQSSAVTAFLENF